MNFQFDVTRENRVLLDEMFTLYLSAGATLRVVYPNLSEKRKAKVDEMYGQIEFALKVTKSHKSIEIVERAHGKVVELHKLIIMNTLYKDALERAKEANLL